MRLPHVARIPRTGMLSLTVSGTPSNVPSGLPSRQRAVLSWSEQWVIDPDQITDEDAVRLRSSLDEKDCASLTTALAVFESLTRTRLALGLASSRTA